MKKISCVGISDKKRKSVNTLSCFGRICGPGNSQKYTITKESTASQSGLIT
jgi:hypothetical protein